MLNARPCGIGDEAIPVATAFAIQRSADLDLQVARHLDQGDRDKSRGSKEQQISLLQASLKAARDASATHDAEVLERVLERAQLVAVQLQDLGDDGDSDVVRRHCVHEVGLCRAMSLAGFRSGADSDGSGADIANLDDVNFSPPSSPPGSPRPSRRSGSPSRQTRRSRTPTSQASTRDSITSSEPRRAPRRGIRSFFKNAMRNICMRASRGDRNASPPLTCSVSSLASQALHGYDAEQIT